VKGTPKGLARSSPVPSPRSVARAIHPDRQQLLLSGWRRAFNALANRLTTRSENAIGHPSMVAIARLESETGVVKVADQTFQERSMVCGPSARSLGCRLHPTEFERERLVRAIAARAPCARLTRSRSAEGKTPRVATSSSRAGKVDHGRPLQAQPKEAMSTSCVSKPTRAIGIWGGP